MAETDSGIALLPEELRHWIGSQLDASVVAVERVSGGASRLGYRVHVESADKLRKVVFLRMDSGAGPLSNTGFTLAREYKVLSRLDSRSVAIPRIFGFNDTHQALLMECVAGTADFASLTDGGRAADVQKQLIEQIAALHRLPFDFQEALDLEPALTIARAVRAEIELWSSLYQQKIATPRPALSFALDWLQRRLPDWSGAAVLVHGDIGPGNFMFDEQGIRALIDWELVHAGHPFEDLASVIARTLGVPFGNIGDHLRTYARCSGEAVAREDLAYCLALVLTRWCIAIAMGLDKPSATVDVAVLERFLQVNIHALIKLMADMDGGSAADTWTPPAVSAPAPPEAGLLAHAREVLDEQIAPALTDAYTQYRCRGLQGVLARVEDVLAYGPERLRTEELSELAALNGAESDDIEDARRMLATRIPHANDAQRRTILAWLQLDSHRRHWLMRRALGEMFDRQLVLE